MTTIPESSPSTAEIYWRPGCRYCSALRRDLERRAVPAVWRNIWADEEARAFARQGQATVSWCLGLLAVAGWWLTRPLRRAHN